MAERQRMGCANSEKGNSPKEKKKEEEREDEGNK